MNTEKIVCCKSGWLAMLAVIGLSPIWGCSDAESQRILSEAGSKSPFAAKAPPQPAPPVAKAAAAANAAAPANIAAAPANNAAPPAAAAAPADPDAGPADVAPAQNANPPAANPAAAAPAAAPQAANPPAAPAEGGGGFFSNLAKGVSDKLKKPADQPAAQPQQAGDPANQVKAGVGVGKKGRGYGGGLIAAIVSTRFSAEERIIFEAQIPKQMQTYKALHDRAPKTHEEFMKEIIQAAEIRLPELPAGDRYVYDPKTEELMVETTQ